MVYYPRSTQYSDVKVPPVWHQWLRYTRDTPPTLEEQILEQQRQHRIRMLAAQADARWAAKPRIGEEGMGPSRVTGQELENRALESSSSSSSTQAAGTPGGKAAGGSDAAGPWGQWERAREAKEQWQPAAWSPAKSKA
jgi:NADH dehydrogenase [ubiquinone] 1 alpha subcomplex assembly factor 2